jgi:hypothetical protein
MAPLGATDRFEDLQALHCFGNDGKDMCKTKHGIKGDTQDFWRLAQRDVYAVDGTFTC